MNTEPPPSDARWSDRRILLEVVLVAVAYAMLATGGELLLTGGEMDPDAPGLAALNIPAAFLFWALFGITAAMLSLYSASFFNGWCRVLSPGWWWRCAAAGSRIYDFLKFNLESIFMTSYLY